MTPVTRPLQFRVFRKIDLPAVLTVENLCFPSPWSEGDFVRCMKERNHAGMLAELEGMLAGFFVYALYRDRIQVLNLAVHPARRRLGVGAQMIAKLNTKVLCLRRPRLTAEVRETNLAAQLFPAQGFRAVQVLRGFYVDSREDAFLLERRSAEWKGPEIPAELAQRMARFP